MSSLEIKKQILKKYINLCKTRSLDEICIMINNNDHDDIKNVINMYGAGNGDKLVDIYVGYHLMKGGNWKTNIANQKLLIEHSQEIKKDITALIQNINKEVQKMMNIHLDRKCINKKGEIKTAITHMVTKHIDNIKIPLGPLGIIAKPIIKQSISETVNIIIDEQFNAVTNMIPKETITKEIAKKNIKNHIDNFFNSKKEYIKALSSYEKLIKSTLTTISNELINMVTPIQDKINKICHMKT